MHMCIVVTRLNRKTYLPLCVGPDSNISLQLRHFDLIDFLIDKGINVLHLVDFIVKKSEVDELIANK